MDNASYNDVLARYLKRSLLKWKTAVLGGDHLHMRCAAHIINLVVTEGLKENIQCVSRTRDSVAYMRKSAARIAKFKEVCALEDVEYKKHIWLDSPTRWNGAYLMLERALPYKAGFTRYALIDPQMRVELLKDGSDVPDDEDWENVARLTKFLAHFCKVTKKVSGSWYMTSNLYLPEISDMLMELRNLEKDEDEHVASMSKRMIEKFTKYWGDPASMNMNLFFAVLLDPKHKFFGLNFILENLFGKEDSGVHSAVIRSELERLYKAYFDMYAPKPSSSGKRIAKSSKAPPRSMKSLAALAINSAQSPEMALSELDQYLAESPDFQMLKGAVKVDLLEWWKVHSLRFPTLSKLAKDVLAVPVSSVASECAFSTCGRVLTDFRSSLSPTSVEALICAQDWLYPRNVKMPTVEEDLDKLEQIETGAVLDDIDENEGEQETEEDEEGEVDGEDDIEDLTLD